MSRKFCRRPFEWLEIHGRIVHTCCPGWMRDEGEKISIEGKSVKEIWNHQQIQDLRASILDGSFRYCSGGECPFLAQPDLPHWESQGSPVSTVDEITDPRLLKIIEQRQTVLKDPPLIWNCCNDKTCNLSCPTCRWSLLKLEKALAKREIEWQDQIMNEIGDHLHYLYVTGTGDPFASLSFRTLLRGLSNTRYPNLEVHLHTNGLLWTPKNWEAMSGINGQVTSAHISIDAATPETYAMNRRGGRWETLMVNLKYISELRKYGPLKFVMISCVVQKNNFREMPAFVELAEQYGFDLAFFSKIRDWNKLDPLEFEDRAIANPQHPEFFKLLKVLTDPRFKSPVSGLANFLPLRQQALKLDLIGN